VDHGDPRRPWPLWLRIPLAVVGFLSLIWGLVELVLPGPGIPFVALGYFLLVPSFPWLAIPVVRALRRWPRIRRAVPKRFRRRPPRKRGEP
jgi:hypothetical protein